MDLNIFTAFYTFFNPSIEAVANAYPIVRSMTGTMMMTMMMKMGYVIRLLSLKKFNPYDPIYYDAIK